MNADKKSKITEQFLNLSFGDKKKELLETLKKLFWDSETVNKLWEIVYNTNNEQGEPLLIEIYWLLLDAIFYGQDRKNEKAVESVKLATKSFNKLKQQEKSERLAEEIDLNNLLAILN